MKAVEKVWSENFRTVEDLKKLLDTIPPDTPVTNYYLADLAFNVCLRPKNELTVVIADRREECD